MKFYKVQTYWAEVKHGEYIMHENGAIIINPAHIRIVELRDGKYYAIHDAYQNKFIGVVTYDTLKEIGIEVIDLTGGN